MILFYFGIVLLIINFVSILDLSLGNRKFKLLKTFPVDPKFAFPKLSIVLAAKDEQNHIERCVESLLALDYPDFELIVVNDRSRDNTQEILSRLSQKYDSLIVETIQDLPKGWLGKNHALVQGFKRTRGEWLLFTDGDVLFEKLTLKKALEYACRSNLDHLPVMPEILGGSFWYNAAVPAFTFYLLQYMRPWLAENPKKKNFMGVGGFNLLRRKTYLAVGTHESIKMRPDEDIRLGELVKKSGAAQEAVLGNGMVKVQWYSNLREICNGLEKNTLAGINYRTWFMLLSLCTMFVIHVFPTLCLFFTHEKTLTVFTALVTLQIVGFADHMRFYEGNPWRAFLFPISVSIYLYILARASVITVFNNGIRWRGTFYSLDELKGKSESPQNPSSR